MPGHVCSGTFHLQAQVRVLIQALWLVDWLRGRRAGMHKPASPVMGAPGIPVLGLFTPTQTGCSLGPPALGAFGAAASFPLILPSASSCLTGISCGLRNVHFCFICSFLLKNVNTLIRRKLEAFPALSQEMQMCEDWKGAAPACAWGGACGRRGGSSPRG